jgi:hypothetical protein
MYFTGTGDGYHRSKRQERDAESGKLLRQKRNNECHRSNDLTCIQS